MEAALDAIKPGVSTDQVARLWPTAQDIGLPDEKTAFGLQFGHGLGLALHERPIISRLSSLDAPMEIEKGMVFAVETYCPASDGVSAARLEEEVVVVDDGVADHHQVPLRGTVRHQPVLRSRHPDGLRGAMDEATALGLYRTMTRIRQFEKRAHDLFLQNLVKGTTHLGTGQEAVAAGVAAAMRPDDYTFVTYRGHNHVLARGTAMTPVMAELLGRENGLMRGKGGSMHLLDVSKGVLGSYAIVGAQLVIANGAAWSAQYRGTGQVTVCFFGDGATNIGAFHEALNLAAVWALPVVFICENNQYMEYTAIETVTAVKQPAADRASAYGLAPQIVDGNDVEAVHAMAGRRDREGAPGRRPVADRGAHLPARRALAGRPRPSTGPRRRWRSGWPATRSRPTGRS